eukprot:m51a1_g927 hypothetical protein (315) ;mRNA; f:205404-206536
MSGEDVVGHFTQTGRAVVKFVQAPPQSPQHRAVLGALEALGVRMDRGFDRLEQRFDSLERSFGRLERSFDSLVLSVRGLSGVLEHHVVSGGHALGSSSPCGAAPEVLAAFDGARQRARELARREQAARRLARQLGDSLAGGRPRGADSRDRGVPRDERGAPSEDYEVAAPLGLAAALGVLLGPADRLVVTHHGRAPNCGPLALAHALGLPPGADVRRAVAEYMEREHLGEVLLANGFTRRDVDAVAEMGLREVPVEELFLLVSAMALNRRVSVVAVAGNNLFVRHYAVHAPGVPGIVMHRSGTYYSVVIQHSSD